MQEIDGEEWMKINNSLEKHHAVFYKIWQIGKPYFTDEIETAAVKFDSDGEFFDFLFNRKFWDEISFNKKLFVICHEVLHILLDHGKRARVNSYAVNCCLDVVINHMLLNKFNFKKSEIENWEQYCWVETVFKDVNPTPPTNECFEYYFKIYKKNYGDGNCGDGTNNPKILDQHSGLGERYDNQKIEKILKKISEGLTQEEKESFTGKIKNQIEEINKTRSDDAYGSWMKIQEKQIVTKRKWETVIKKWALKGLSNSNVEKQQWARKNRRLYCMKNDVFLPSDMKTEEYSLDKTKIDLWFFLDTSGSCISLKDRFFNAARSLSKERFVLRLFSFDTKVEEIEINNKKIYGGGGTKFDILEEKIQKTIKSEKKRYPNAIFVITDGYGNNISPEFPERWHWFLTKYSYKFCIDKRCNIYNLNDYE